ncbi:hypothetical protein [Armatimonas sp.]|uniref:hypothetical protein n=1 Tax=Armatimonas sp. TaxID=1872638 RepID=UPI00286CD156|nr:hypothetical protein [Armatimonas sp.]
METPTPQTEDEIIDWLNSRGNGDQDENGIPLDALRENRRLTPRQRVEKLEAFVYGIRVMRAHAKVVRRG